jgi:hypothetical protein
MKRAKRALKNMQHQAPKASNQLTMQHAIVKNEVF